ncbi:hypothetical protein DL767_006681 [Monosporascus sp. MG133]|nr:hypothetical protein DL767_006681 [Monosporascus sp. MG133]
MAGAQSDRREGAQYELVYWHIILGRGEDIRVCFAEAGVPYSDTANMEDGIDNLDSYISEQKHPAMTRIVLR